MREAPSVQFLQQLVLEQVHLPEVRLRRVARHTRPMLHGDTGVRVAFDAEPFDEGEARFGVLAEGMRGRAAQRDNRAVHGATSA
jgi:hypothetical protein